MRDGPVLELVEGLAEVTAPPLPPGHRLGGTDLKWLLKILVARPVIGHGQMKDGRARTSRVDGTGHRNQRGHEDQKREDRRPGDDPEHDHERAIQNPVSRGQRKAPEWREEKGRVHADETGDDTFESMPPRTGRDVTFEKRPCMDLAIQAEASWTHSRHSISDDVFGH